MTALELRKHIQHILGVAADGDFGKRTWAAYRKAAKPAVELVQEALGCAMDGVRGPETDTFFAQLDDTPGDHVWSPASTRRVVIANTVPASGPLHPPLSRVEREQTFGGPFKWRHRPVAGNRENIEILGDWEAQNIVRIAVPQLHSVPGNFTHMSVNRRVVKQWLRLWQDWEDAGLLPLVLSYEGAFVPRLIRGSTTSLSNHAYGTAFDINYFWNQLGKVPARAGTKGSVRELVPIAHRNGFYWGGNFSRLDGMHFEVCKILP